MLDIVFQRVEIYWLDFDLEENFDEDVPESFPTFMDVKATLQVVLLLLLVDDVMPFFLRKILGMQNLLKIDGNNLCGGN